MSQTTRLSEVPVAARPYLAGGVRLRTDPVTGKPVLLYPEGVLILNPTGAAILELCGGGRTVEQIASALATRFAAPVDRITEDVRQYVGCLRARRLLELQEEEDPG